MVKEGKMKCFGLERLNEGHVSLLPSFMVSVQVLFVYFATLKQQNPAGLISCVGSRTSSWSPKSAVALWKHRTLNLQRLNTKMMQMHYW